MAVFLEHTCIELFFLELVSDEVGVTVVVGVVYLSLSICCCVGAASVVVGYGCSHVGSRNACHQRVLFELRKLQ